MHNKFSGRMVLSAMVVLAAASILASGVSAQVHGTIHTTNSDGTTVQQNFYEKKQDVYLDGGPVQPHLSGLPVGFYHVRITDPSGKVELGSSWLPSKDKTVAPIEVVPGPGPGAGGSFLQLYKIWDIVWYINGNGNGPAQQGYKDTPNKGGVYKIMISHADNFINPTGGSEWAGSNIKMKTFKVRQRGNGQLGAAEFTACKFYDTEGDGVYNDATNPPISEWRFRLWKGASFASATVVDLGAGATYMETDSNGCVIFSVESPSSGTDTYWIEELMPLNTATVIWKNSTPLVQGPINVVSGLPTDTITDLGTFNFLNYAEECIEVLGYGLTKGYWQIHNPNGTHDLMHCPSNWEAALNALCLRDNDGNHFTVSETDRALAREQVGEWIVGGPADNPAYQLSTQLAALVLNIHCGNLKGYNSLMIEYNNVLMDMNDFIAIAVDLLCNNPNPAPASAAAIAMDALKDFIDDVNNSNTGTGSDIPVYACQILPPIPVFSYA
jgi:hypothetical protein